MAKPAPALDLIDKLPAKFPPVCVLFGDEDYLHRQVIGAIRKAVLGEGDAEFSYRVFDGEEASLREVLDELITVSLFGDGQRVVLVDNADDFVKRYRPELEDYIERPGSAGILLLSASSWPSNTKLYKKLADVGLQIDCKTPDVDTLVKWLKQQAKLQGVTFGAEADHRLLEIVGPEMGRLEQEVAKLALIGTTTVANSDAPPKSRGQITREMVDQLVGGWRAKTAWEMIDLALAGEAAGAIEQLDRLLAAGEHPIGLLAQCGASLRRLAAATRLVAQADAQKQRIQLRQALEQAGVKTWPAAMNKAEAQLRQLSRSRGEQIYRWLLEADLAMKGSSSAPARARSVLEQLFAKMAKQTVAAGSVLRT